MDISVQDFEVGSGVKFKIISDGTTEDVLLKACVNDDGPLVYGEEDNEYILTVGVSQ